MTGMGADGMTETAARWRRTREGDLDSLEWLVERMSPLLRAHALYRLAAVTAGESELDDLVQEAWMVLLLKKDEVEFPDRGTRGAILAYLGQVILHKANNLLRREVRRRTRSESEAKDGREGRVGLDEMAVTTARALRKVEQKEAAQAVVDAMGVLAAQDRDILMQRLFEGRSNQVIGEELGLDSNTVAQRFRRSLAGLRERINPAHAEVLADLLGDD